jgi:hypothetical protein
MPLYMLLAAGCWLLAAAALFSSPFLPVLTAFSPWIRFLS